MPLHVVIADDDEDIRLTLRTLLEGEGFTVSEASTGPATIQLLRTLTERCVVLLDLLMGENGSNVLGVVALDEALALRHRFILLTAIDTPRIPAAVMEFGYPLVKKPFDIDAILAVIQLSAVTIQP